MHPRTMFRAVTLGMAATTLAPNAVSATKTTRPNIIFVLSDDVGIGDIGCYGSDNFRTPQIDALAKSGVRFAQCYSTPLCGPSRATILTGRYPFRTGMTHNQAGAVVRPENEIMIPRVLKPAGYASAQVGKWSQLQLRPSDWGFDEYLQFAGSGKYWPNQDPTYTLNGKTVRLQPGTYLPDVMHGFVVDFMTRHRNEPFYIHYAMSHIHGPILRTADSTRGSKDLYADNIAYMDKLVGRLVADLDRLKLRDKTLIVFVGDNGTARFGADRATIGGRRLSGQKGTLLEGGSRVPMIASWPGTVPAGKVTDALVDFTDFLPTFAALAGARLPEGVTIDGHDFGPQLHGKRQPGRDWVYVELNGKWYARSRDWKLNSAGQLFDMKDAPFVEAVVPKDTTDTKALAARKQLQAVLDQLNPAAGKQSVTAKTPGKKARKAAKRAAGQAQAAPAPRSVQQRQAERRALRRANRGRVPGNSGVPTTGTLTR